MLTIHFDRFDIENKYEKDIQRMPDGIRGIYLIYSEDNTLIYIGKSDNLRSRLRSHFSGTSHLKQEISDTFYSFSCVYVSDKAMCDIYETAFINHLMPLANTSKVYYVQDTAAINKKLKEKKRTSLGMREGSENSFEAFKKLYDSINSAGAEMIYDLMHEYCREGFVDECALNSVLEYEASRESTGKYMQAVIHKKEGA